jgi:uncharacterized protein (TIGR02145 family)
LIFYLINNKAMKHSILLLFIIVLPFFTIKAQNIECIGNTIEIPLFGYKNGTIQWQFSTNEIDWINLANANTDKLTHIINETGYFRAKVSYGNCEYFSDITYIEALPATTAIAGTDQNVITGLTSTTLNGNVPAFGTGLWTIKSGVGGSLTNSSLPKTTFTGIIGNKYVLSWTISAECATTSDDVTVNFYNPLHSVSDYDGNIYNTVTINSVEWMAENLKTTKNINGDLINSWAYDGIESNADIYGRLYTYDDARYGSICPDGWHLPSDDEWGFMADNLGGLTVAGGKLKESGTTHWKSPNTNATNESGFNALPAGYRLSNGSYNAIGQIGGWWSSVEENWDESHDWYINYNGGNLISGLFHKTYGVSVRCVKDF